jgi:hypothetical protein
MRINLSESSTRFGRVQKNKRRRTRDALRLVASGERADDLLDLPN